LHLGGRATQPAQQVGIVSVFLILTHTCGRVLAEVAFEDGIAVPEGERMTGTGQMLKL
jgi:hypothetical protein